MKKKVVLIGAQGMLGHQIFEDWSNDDQFQIIPLGRFNMDISKVFEIGEKLSLLSPDIVINAAGWTNVDKAEEIEYREMVFQINANAPEEIAKFCHVKGIPFFHFSTDYVFSGKEGDIFDESSSINPINIYGESKAEGEKKVLEYSQSRVIRTAWLAGDSAPNFVHQMVHFAKTKPELTVVNDQFGSPSFCHSVSKALHKMMKDPQKYSQGIYHAVCDGNISRFELTKKIVEILKINKPVYAVSSDIFESQAARPKSSALKNTLLDSLGNWDEELAIFLSDELEKLEKSRVVAQKKGIDHI